MRRVADHLKSQALLAANADEFDLFGRSAFNRYYYATFLIVRAGLRRMSLVAKSGEIAHASVPEILSGTVYKRLKKACTDAKRIGDGEAISLFSVGALAARDLASLMNSARASRTTADYHPEMQITKSGKGFLLITVNVDQAQTWPHKAETLINRIAAAWRQLES